MAATKILKSHPNVTQHKGRGKLYEKHASREAVLGNVTRDTRAARSLMRVFVMTIKRTTTWQELGVRGGKYHISWPSVINY